MTIADAFAIAVVVVVVVVGGGGGVVVVVVVPLFMDSCFCVIIWMVVHKVMSHLFRQRQLFIATFGHENHL